MKNKLSKTISFSAFMIMALFAAQAAVIAQGQKADDDVNNYELFNQSPKAIVGVWETTVTPRSCATGEPLGPPFMGISTYNNGGTVAEFGANPAAPYRTAGHGLWVAMPAGRMYSLAFTFLALNPMGGVVGRMRVEQISELSRDGNAFESSGSFVLRSPNGDVIGSGCSTATATRFQ